MRYRALPPTTGLMAMVLLLAAAPTARAHWQGGFLMPHHRMMQQQQLPTPAACVFSAANKNLLSDAFLKPAGWVLATTQGALDCMNQIQIGSDFAYSSLVSLARIFNNSYVYSAIAINPPLNAPKIPYNFPIYDMAVDVPSLLTKYASSLSAGGTTNFGDLQLYINQAFNRLRDAGVQFAGSTASLTGTAFGNALGNLTLAGDLGSNRAYLCDTTNNGLLIDLDLASLQAGGVGVAGRFLYPDGTSRWLQFKTINSKPPMDYLIAVANNPALPLPIKPIGTRINYLLDNISSFPTTGLGSITSLPAGDCVLADGSRITLAWGITFAPTVPASKMALIQTQANTPGVPLQALLNAKDTLLSGDITATSAPALAPAPVRPIEELSSTSQVATRYWTRQESSAGLPPFTYLQGNLDSPYGGYFFKNGRAFLKLSDFPVDPQDVQSWFPVFVSKAKAQGATQLVLDLTGSSGASLGSGALLAMGLFPMATYGDLSPHYDIILGEDILHAATHGLDPYGLFVATTKLTYDDKALKARALALWGNDTELHRLRDRTQSVMQALTVLFNSASADQTQVCKNLQQGGFGKCSQVWQPLGQKATSFLDSVARTLSASDLDLFLSHYLGDLLDAFFPSLPLPVDDNGKNPSSNPVARIRGGVKRYYSTKFDLLQGLKPNTRAQDVMPDLGSNFQAQFSKILVLSDGMCSSVCDTFSRSAYFYSLRNPSAPKFKFATFGSTGNKADSTPTYNPGGDVNNVDLLTPTYAYFLTAGLLADWLDDQGLQAQLDTWGNLLPFVPGCLDNLTPTYTQSEIYQIAALGKDSYPMEYYHIPTDFYIPQWFKYTALPQPDVPPIPSDLPSLYQIANQLLDTM